MDLCLLELGLVLHNPLVEIVQEVLLVSLRRSLPDLDCLLLFELFFGFLDLLLIFFNNLLTEVASFG
jgi:hypothetical protein